MEARTILIVDDHPTVRLGLRALLEGQPDLSVCGEASNVREARELVEAERPDAVVVDLSLRDESGLDLVREVAAQVPVLVLSVYDEALYAERALQAGARGYVKKDAPAERILEALRVTLDDQLAFSPDTTQRLLRRQLGGGSAPGQDPLQRLSDRQLHIYELLGRGRSTREIARALELSVKTVETHIANIKRRLGVRSLDRLRTEAAVRLHQAT